MRRLAARLLIAGVALALGAEAAGCSAAPGLAYAQAQGAAHATAGASGAPTAMVPASARGKTSTGPMIDVVGAPAGVKAKAGIVA